MKIVNIDFHNDLSPVILWQYLDAEKMRAMVNNEQEFMDTNVRDFWEKFNHDVLNLMTCDEFGLSLWGKLLKIQRPVYQSGGISYVFNDEQYRLLLRARIYLLNFDGSAKALNDFFKTMFPDIMVDIEDNLNMTVTINFLSELSPDIEAVLRLHETDAVTGEPIYLFLPRPSGVKYILNTEVDYSKVFGFEGMTHNEYGIQKEAPAFTDKSSSNYDPTTDGGGTFLQ